MDRKEANINKKRIEDMRIRCERASKGPWKIFRFRGRTEVVAMHYGDNGYSVGVDYEKFADARFVAHARADIPYLLSEMERLAAYEALASKLGGYEELCLLVNAQLEGRK